MPDNAEIDTKSEVVCQECIKHFDTAINQIESVAKTATTVYKNTTYNSDNENDTNVYFDDARLAGEANELDDADLLSPDSMLRYMLQHPPRNTFLHFIRELALIIGPVFISILIYCIYDYVDIWLLKMYRSDLPCSYFEHPSDCEYDRLEHEQDHMDTFHPIQF